MLEDLKAALNVWNALKHAPTPDVLFAVGLYALYRAKKWLLSRSWKPKSWKVIFFMNDSRFSAQYNPKDNSKTRKKRRAKNKIRRNALTNHHKTAHTLHSPRTPKSLPSDKSSPSDH